MAAPESQNVHRLSQPHSSMPGNSQEGTNWPSPSFPQYNHRATPQVCIFNPLVPRDPQSRVSQAPAQEEVGHTG